MNNKLIRNAFKGNRVSLGMTKNNGLELNIINHDDCFNSHGLIRGVCNA